MNEQQPIACSLGAGDLERRLAAIAEIGEESLIDREVVEDRWLLRFRRNDRTRQLLETIIEGEAECCPFLDLAFVEQSGDLVLSIAAPEDGRPVADQLAAAFAGGRGPAPSAP